MPGDDNSSTPETRGPGSRLTLWLAGSAVLGSLALVLWNRRTLKTLREAAENPVEPLRDRDDDGIY